MNQKYNQGIKCIMNFLDVIQNGIQENSIALKKCLSRPILNQEPTGQRHGQYSVTRWMDHCYFMFWSLSILEHRRRFKTVSTICATKHCVNSPSSFSPSEPFWVVTAMYRKCCLLWQMPVCCCLEWVWRWSEGTAYLECCSTSNTQHFAHPNYAIHAEDLQIL